MDNKFHFAPSQFHRGLREKTTKTLAFAKNDADIKKWRRQLTSKLKNLLGVGAEQNLPINTRIMWEREHPLGRIQKIVFTSEPLSDVPAYVCVPRGARPPFDFMICLQGHSTGMHNSIGLDFETESKEINVEGDRDFALGCMKRGIAALCIEQRAFGERREGGKKSVEKHSCQEASMHALMLGRTLVGERVLDVEKGIEYLKTRGDFNKNTLGIMGNSGGGTTSVYAAALIPDIKFAMPSCSFGTFETSKMAVRHCPCGYIPGIMKYAGMEDVLGLFAPKPVVIVAGEEDPVVPLQSVKQGFSRLRRIYKAFGAEDKCRLIIGAGGHRFYAEDAWPEAIEQIKQLKNLTAPL